MKKVFERDLFNILIICFVNISVVCMISEVFQHFSNWCDEFRKIRIMINVAFRMADMGFIF